MNRTVSLADDPAQAAESGPLPIRETFDAFYLREYPAMVALAAAVGRDRSAAEEVAQEAMLRAHRHWKRISSYDRPGAWARRVTINLATSLVRRRLTELRILPQIAPGAPLPDPALDDADVWAAVRALPRKQRAAIALHYLEDRPVREIASILDCTESTAKVHLHKGRAALGRVLGTGGES